MDQMVKEELAQHFVFEAEREDVGWANPIYLIPKKDGGFRKILDCRGVNAFMKEIHFQFDGLETRRKQISYISGGKKTSKNKIFLVFPFLPGV